MYFDDYHREEGLSWKPRYIHPDPTASVSECHKDSISCEAQSCERNQWIFG